MGLQCGDSEFIQLGAAVGIGTGRGVAGNREDTCAWCRAGEGAGQSVQSLVLGKPGWPVEKDQAGAGGRGPGRVVSCRPRVVSMSATPGTWEI